MSMTISLRSQFDNIFGQRSAETPGPPPIETAGVGTPMFTMDDVRKAPGILDKLLRGIFIKQGITKEVFDSRYRDYALNTLGLHSTSLNSAKGNMLKALYRGRISPLIFHRALASMGYELCNMTVELHTTAGEALVLSIKDIMKMSDETGDVENIEDAEVED